MRVLMSELTWTEYENRVKEDILFLPVGSNEQHGYHLPLGTDTMQIEEITKLIAERVNGIVAPSVSYGYKSLPHSGGGQIFPGTTSLSGQTLIYLVKDLLLEFIRHGATKIVVMDGHYENGLFLSEAIDLALKEANNPQVKVVKSVFVDMLDMEVVHQIFPDGFPGFALEHAALIETSLMLKLKPDLVQEEKIVPDNADQLPVYEVFPQPEGIVPDSGVLSDPTGATAEKGELMINNVVDNYVAAMKKEFNI